MLLHLIYSQIPILKNLFISIDTYESYFFKFFSLKKKFTFISYSCKNREKFKYIALWSDSSRIYFEIFCHLQMANPDQLFSLFFVFTFGNIIFSPSFCDVRCDVSTSNILSFRVSWFFFPQIFTYPIQRFCLYI